MLQFTDQEGHDNGAKAAWNKVRKAENDYSRRLRLVARHINDLVEAFVTREHGYPIDLEHLVELLDRYANLIEPWARATATRFLAEVSRRDERAWARYSRRFSRALEQEVRTAPTGEALQRFLETQVELITSLPREASERVHEIAVGNLFGFERAASLAEHILETGDVSRNRANLIARTETARVASALTMVRAQHLGSPGYFWHSVRDHRVRDTHRIMDNRSAQGEMFYWDNPPEVEPGMFYHPGMIWNCRCFAEPIIPDVYNA
jgi:SPP1 gp7 family putative phage head morphogenesis protein